MGFTKQKKGKKEVILWIALMNYNKKNEKKWKKWKGKMAYLACCYWRSSVKEDPCLSLSTYIEQEWGKYLAREQIKAIIALGNGEE